MPPLHLVLLGVAQDAGVPQTGCSCSNCSDVWAGAMPRQFAVSAALVDPASSSVWLIDCTPDLRDQYHTLLEWLGGQECDWLRSVVFCGCKTRVLGYGTANSPHPSLPLCSLCPLPVASRGLQHCKLVGVLLTHLHSGHYLGLVQFGRETMDWRGLQVRPGCVCAVPGLRAFLSVCRLSGWRDVAESGVCAAGGRAPQACCAPPALSTHPHPAHSFNHHPLNPHQVYGTQSVLDFLQTNQPWKQYLNKGGNFILMPALVPGQKLQLSDALSVTPVAVPHRAEFSDAVGYYVHVRVWWGAFVNLQLPSISDAQPGPSPA